MSDRVSESNTATAGAVETTSERASGIPANRLATRTRVQDFEKLAEEVRQAFDALPEASLPSNSPMQMVHSPGGGLSVYLPSLWKGVETGPWMEDDGDDRIGKSIVAAPEDVDRLYDGWEGPGVFVAASSQFVDAELLLSGRRVNLFYSCEAIGRGDFEGLGYKGHYELWSNCGGNTQSVVVAAMNGSDGIGSILIYGRATNQEELQQISETIESITVEIGQL